MRLVELAGVLVIGILAIALAIGFRPSLSHLYDRMGESHKDLLNLSQLLVSVTAGIIVGAIIPRDATTKIVLGLISGIVVFAALVIPSHRHNP